MLLCVLLIRFKDSQEFLRCFMDRLHEELKQPIVELNVTNDQNADDIEDTDSEHSSITDEQITAMRHRRVPSAVYCDAIEASDTDYETCDSGLSSENSSEATFAVSGTVDGIAGEAEDATIIYDDSGTLPVCAATSDRMEEACTEIEMPGRTSVAELSESAVGDVGTCTSLVKSSCVKCETGAGELGAAAMPCELSCLMTGFSGVMRTNVSAPSSDSALSDDGSGSSMHTDSDACHGEDSSSVHLPKVDSSRSLQSSHSSRKSSPRVKEMVEGNPECSGKVRRTSEATTLQSAGMSNVINVNILFTS